MSEVRGSGHEELRCVRAQGQQQRLPGCNSARATKRSYSQPNARGGGLEELSHA